MLKGLIIVLLCVQCIQTDKSQLIKLQKDVQQKLEGKDEGTPLPILKTTLKKLQKEIAALVKYIASVYEKISKCKPEEVVKLKRALDKTLKPEYNTDLEIKYVTDAIENYKTKLEKIITDIDECLPTNDNKCVGNIYETVAILDRFMYEQQKIVQSYEKIALNKIAGLTEEIKNFKETNKL